MYFYFFNAEIFALELIRILPVFFFIYQTVIAVLSLLSCLISLSLSSKHGIPDFVFHHCYKEFFIEYSYFSFIILQSNFSLRTFSWLFVVTLRVAHLLICGMCSCHFHTSEFWLQLAIMCICWFHISFDVLYISFKSLSKEKSEIQRFKHTSQ